MKLLRGINLKEFLISFIIAFLFMFIVLFSLYVGSEQNSLEYISSDIVSIAKYVLYDNRVMWLVLLFVSFGINHYIGIRRLREARIQRTLVFIAQLRWKNEETGFFVPLVRFLAKEFSVKYALVDEIHQGKCVTAKTIALISDDDILENIEYELVNTPCENVYGKKLCTYKENIQSLFPKDHMLVEMGAESYVGLPLFASDGEPIGLIALMDDQKISKSKEIEVILQLVAARAAQVLERKIYEKKLNEMLIFNKKIVNTVEEGIVVYDENLNYLVWNDAITNLSNVTFDNIYGKNVLEVFPELADNGHYERLVHTLQTGEENLDYYEYVNPNNEKHWFKDVNKQLKDDDGNILGVIKTVIDITSTKENEMLLMKLKEAADKENRSKSDFLSNMSHEIRTPMNGIVGMIELSMLENTNMKLNEYLKVAKESTNSLLSIVNDILDYSKLEVDKMTISSEPYEVKTLINDIKTLFEYTASKKNIVFTVLVDENIPIQLVGDTVRIRQVLTNFLSNAFKFTHSGSVCLSVILLEQSEDTVKVRFSVKDTGIGIPKDKYINLFERFDQLDDSITRNFGGSGLGLAISKGFVELMGGSISCISEESAGSTFSFELDVPYSNQEVIHKESMRSEGLKEVVMEKSVLVVDDDVVNRKVMNAIVEKLGHKITLAKNGQEAINICRLRQFDIVLMDISMPIVDGYEAVSVIRHIEGYQSSQTPIIALTGFSLDGGKEEYLTGGFDDYLSKPVDMKEIAVKISDWT